MINSSKSSHAWLNAVDALGNVNRFCVYSAESMPKSLEKDSWPLTTRKPSNCPFPGFTIDKTDNSETSLVSCIQKSLKRQMSPIFSCDVLKGLSKAEWEKVKYDLELQDCHNCPVCFYQQTSKVIKILKEQTTYLKL